jgi:hypothetical protein
MLEEFSFFSIQNAYLKYFNVKITNDALNQDLC